MKHFFLKLGFVFASTLAFAQVPTNGLVGYWPFNGNANDASGNGHDLTAIGGVFSNDRFGTNNAYTLNGTSEYLFTTAVSTTTDLSASMWIYIKSYPTNAAGCEFFGEGIGDSKGYGLKMENKKLALMAYGKVGNFTNDITTLETNKWYHFTIIKSSTNFSLYVNGGLSSSGLISINPIVGFLSIGGIKSSSTGVFANFLNGTVDDIRVYNRALNQTEITALYNESTCFKTVTVSDTLRISTITGLNELPLNFGTIKVFPNPTNDVLNISVSNPSPNYTIKITNSTSQTLFTTQLTTSSYQLNLNTLGAKGLYFIQILDNTNKVLETKKLVLE
jgi:hypothetical protein